MHLRLSWRVWTAALVLALTLMQPEEASAANILALFPFSSRSHNNMYSNIINALVKKGHSFTVVTSVPMDSPPAKYKQIDLSKEMAANLNAFNSTEKISIFGMLQKMKHLTVDVCEKTFNQPEVKELLSPSNPSDRFDLIIISNFFSECLFGFAHRYKAPVVLFSPSERMLNTYKLAGNVALPSMVSYPILGFSDKMTFTQRLVNTVVSFLFSTYYEQYVVRNMEYVMKEAFGDDCPSISELEKRISLIITNGHFSFNGAHPSVPNLIQCGGLHVKPPKELPQDLKSFLDGAGNNGVIYFSLGSVLKSASIPEETRNALVGAFSQLKQKVLWKWEGATPIPGQTKNIRPEKWLPQQDLLDHPNVKLFITHGGLLSFQEASSRGVPLIGIPFFGDQDMNMNRVVELEVGLKLDAKNLTTENILNTINQILGDPKYSNNMKKMKAIVNDQIDHPLDRAVYWVEYVLRHKGAYHLTPASKELYWYQLYMFDVLFAVVVIPSIIGTILTYFIVKLLIKRCCSAKKKSTESLKKTQ